MKTTLKAPATLPKPNEVCWCGSGTKYKKCHKELDATNAREERKQLELTRVKPGVRSPMREVPLHIRRPDYASTGTPTRGSGRLKRTPEEADRLRHACKVAARILREAGEQVKPGVTTDEIDAFVHDLTIKLGAYPSTLNYRGFTKSLCTSVNEIICHGIPDSRKLVDGDIVNLDVTAFLDGMHGDCNATFLVGNVDEESKRLVQVTHEALLKGIEAAKPGRPLSDIGRAIENHVTPAGFSVVRNYCGHAIADFFHGPLQVPHYFDARAKTVLEPGWSFTIEPMVNAGGWEDALWDDGWTAVTADLKRSAQFEHTILMTETGAEILTKE